MYMRNIKKYLLWILGVVLVVFVVGLLFMRFVVVPGEARSECNEYALKNADEVKGMRIEEAYSFLYDSCFKQRGLRPETR